MNKPIASENQVNLTEKYGLSKAVGCAVARGILRRTTAPDLERWEAMYQQHGLDIPTSVRRILSDFGGGEFRARATLESNAIPMDIIVDPSMAFELDAMFGFDEGLCVVVNRWMGECMTPFGVAGYEGEYDSVVFYAPNGSLIAVNLNDTICVLGRSWVDALERSLRGLRGSYMLAHWIAQPDYNADVPQLTRTRERIRWLLDALPPLSTFPERPWWEHIRGGRWRHFLALHGIIGGIFVVPPAELAARIRQEEALGHGMYSTRDEIKT